MLKEGKYCEVIDDNGNVLALLKVYNDKSHCLKIIASNFRTGEMNCVELHSDGEVINLYQFLKEHFEGEDGQRFTHKEYLKYVSDLKAENCPDNEIVSEEQWRAEIEAEFGTDGDADGDS